MKVGVGLPGAIPDISGGPVVEWAKKAEELGFSSLGLIDRVVYSNYEPLITLAAVAAVTKKIRLMTTILLLPNRDTVSFAKQIATLDRISMEESLLDSGSGRGKTISMPPTVTSKLEENDLKNNLLF